MRIFFIVGGIFFAVICAGFIFAVEYDWVIPPPSENYRHKASYMNAAPCKFFTPPEIIKKLKSSFHTLELGGGGDTLSVGPSQLAIVYDSSSPVTLEKHDTAIFYKMHPSAISFKRFEHSLVACSQAYWLKIVFVRQYCRSPGDGKSDAWNNQTEEISFPYAREIWLEDSLFKKLKEDKNPGKALSVIKKYYKKNLKINQIEIKNWKFKPFSDVLPHRLWSSYYCRKDLK